MARDREVLLVFTTHALEEMKKDGIVKLDIANMLKRCSVTKVEETGGEETWRAEGQRRKEDHLGGSHLR